MKNLKEKIKIVSGIRPTGKLHLGHYHGVLKNWIRLQEDHTCFFFVADWHALTTEYEHPEVIQESTRDVLLDWLSVGLDPKKATVFVQSHVKEHAELHVLLSMITPLGWLERVPSYKEMKQELSNKDLSTYGFLGYPLLQAADVALYDGTRVPVGTDQVPHIELAREIVRRFNHLYGNTLIEAQPLLTESPKLLGLDRRKMSKSYNNSIYLSDSADEVQKKIKAAITDPARIRRNDPGNPELCVIYDYHKLHSSTEEINRVDTECRWAKLGCVDDKKRMTEIINAFLDPFRKKREDFLKHPDYLDEVIQKGSLQAFEVAQKTMDRVRKAMKLYG